MDLNNSSNFTSSDFKVIKEAKARIEKYIIFQNNQYVVRVQSGDKIAISDRLFKALEKAISVTNQKLSNGELFYHNGKLYNINVSLSTRTLDKNEETENDKTENNNQGKPVTIRDEGYFRWQETTTYDQEQAVEYWESFQESNSQLSVIMGIAGIGVSAFVNKVAGTAFSGMAFLEALERNNASTAIYNAAKEGSITVETYMDYITGSLNTTVYDQNGSCVTSITYGSTGLF